MTTQPEQLGYLLTAYVEETLTEEGRLWVEAQLAHTPQLQEQLDAIRALRTALIGHLPPAPAQLSAAHRAQLHSHAASRTSRSRWLSRPLFAALAALVMAVVGFLVLTMTFPRSRGDAAADPDVSSLVAASAPSDGRMRAVTMERKLSGGVGYDQDEAAEDGERPTQTKSEELRLITLDNTQHPIDARQSTPHQAGAGSGEVMEAMVPAAAPAAPAATAFSAEDIEWTDRAKGLSDQVAQNGVDAKSELPQSGATPQVPSPAPQATPVAQQQSDVPDSPVDDDKRVQGAPDANDRMRSREIDQHLARPANGPSAPWTVNRSPAEAAACAALPAGLAAAGDRSQPNTVGVSYGYQMPVQRGTALLIAPAPQGGISDRDLLQQFQATSPTATDGAAAERLAQLQPGAALQVNDQSYGQALLAAARRSGLQLRFEDRGCRLHAQAVPLDPTALYGWDAALFTRTFETAPMQDCARAPRLTFALDSDTSSFVMARSRLGQHQLPDPRSIQPEQFINAMPLDYPPASGAATFTLYAEAGPSPFALGALAPRTQLLALGVVTRAPLPDERRPLDLVVAVDCSGSMARPGSLDRIQLALHELAAQLHPDDQLTIVRFSDQAAVALPTTAGDQLPRIDAAISALRCGGSTNGAEGLLLAYQLIAEHHQGGIEHRVLFATDGATLQGPAAGRLWQRLAGYQADGIALMVVGCGGDDRQQRALQDLADHAHGQHVYLASDDQARQLAHGPLLPEHLQILARDAKVQVTWNPQRVASARLIGYEQRRLHDADFRHDDVAAGELSHEVQVTALFEIVLTPGATGPLGQAAVRCFDTRWQEIREQAFPLPGSLLAPVASPRLELCACAAQLAELLQQGWWSNVRCATWTALGEHLRALPTSDAVRTLLEMTETAGSLVSAR